MDGVEGQVDSLSLSSTLNHLTEIHQVFSFRIQTININEQGHKEWQEEETEASLPLQGDQSLSLTFPKKK